VRFVTYMSGKSAPARAGVVVGEHIHGDEAGVAMVDLLGDLEAAGRRLISRPAEVVELGAVELGVPIGTPPSIRDFSAFETHFRTMGRGRPIPEDWYEMPIFYFSNPAAACGPDEEIAVPPGCSDFDYEIELAAVIGRPGHNLTPREGEAHIAGYMVMCDWSARDIQRREMPMSFGPAKGKDGATSFSGMLVTPDELEPFRVGIGFNLAVTVAVNGRTYTDTNFEGIYWSFGEMISYASRGAKVVPGDVIGSGTVGTGCIAELSIAHGNDAYPWLVPGDRVRLEIEHVGAIAASIVTGKGLVPLHRKSAASPGG
jgi:2-keto-4-pentenoate hydratase/2-oxohepta-3-ene-1,7-dioic acid hydratase in catechol pathway